LPAQFAFPLFTLLSCPSLKALKILNVLKPPYKTTTNLLNKGTATFALPFNLQYRHHPAFISTSARGVFIFTLFLLIHILDYKPKAKTEKPYTQLTLYALALSRLTGLKPHDFKCAWFDENDYFEFFPLHIVYKLRG
jgi:hypothetical protein